MSIRVSIKKYFLLNIGLIVLIIVKGSKLQKTRLSPNLLQNITTCTHLVYGSIPIDRDTGYPQYSVSDVESGYDIDNIRTFMRLRKYHPNAKLLMGVVRTKPFEDAATSVKVANGLRSHVKSK